MCVHMCGGAACVCVCVCVRTRACVCIYRRSPNKKSLCQIAYSENSSIGNWYWVGVRPICQHNFGNNRMLNESRIMLE